MFVPSFFYSVGSKISKTVLFLFERDNYAIWFCCFPKIQLNFNCRETLKVAISFSPSVARIHSLVPRTKKGHKLRTTYTLQL